MGGEEGEQDRERIKGKVLSLRRPEGKDVRRADQREFDKEQVWQGRVQEELGTRKEELRQQRLQGMAGCRQSGSEGARSEGFLRCRRQVRDGQGPVPEGQGHDVAVRVALSLPVASRMMQTCVRRAWVSHESPPRVAIAGCRAESKAPATAKGRAAQGIERSVQEFGSVAPARDSFCGVRNTVPE